MKGIKSKKIRLAVNGHIHELEVGGRPNQIKPSHTLAHTLRETLGLTGTKISCDEGACGACTVILDGRTILSCMILTVECHGKDILTIEGLRNPETGELDPIQKSFIDHTAFQCGFCTPGMIMSTKALLLKNSHPTEMDEKGHLYFVDRTVDTIKHKGYRVSASEIESVLQEHPAVIGACVVGVPDQDVGERIKAFVVLKEDIKGITGYDLLKWCRQKLASYKVPQYIEFRDMLPKSKVGKLLRREMRAEERKRHEE